jgi:hypothetical protein
MEAIWKVVEEKVEKHMEEVPACTHRYCWDPDCMTHPKLSETWFDPQHKMRNKFVVACEKDVKDILPEALDGHPWPTKCGRRDAFSLLYFQLCVFETSVQDSDERWNHESRSIQKWVDNYETCGVVPLVFCFKVHTLLYGFTCLADGFLRNLADSFAKSTFRDRVSVYLHVVVSFCVVRKMLKGKRFEDGWEWFDVRELIKSMLYDYWSSVRSNSYKVALVAWCCHKTHGKIINHHVMSLILQHVLQ